MDLLALPTELLIAIISCLDARDILAFCRVCRSTHDVYAGSALLQYLVALLAAGMENAARFSSLDISDRLAYLLRREALWSSVNLSGERRVKIPVNHRHSHVHDLTAGVYIFGDLSLVPDSLRTNSVRHVCLPTCMHRQELLGRDDSLGLWSFVPLGVEAINIGVSLEENDLLAVLTTISLSNEGDGQIFQLHLKKFSTAGYHPLAQEPIIQFHEHHDEGNHCLATIDIAGSYLLVLLNWLRSPNTSDEVYIFDWTTGFLISRNSPGNFTYRGAAFLSIDTFVLTNLRDNAIEFLQLGKASAGDKVAQCRWIGKLALPALQRGSSLVSMCCRTDAIRSREIGMSPTFATCGDETPSATKRHRGMPVHCASDKTLVQFKMYLQRSGAPNADDISLFTFVAHRGELLRIVQSSGALIGTTSPTDIVARPWSTWGPSVTRWCDVDEADTAWVAGIAGQRQVFVTGDRPRHIRVRNFNAAAIRKELLNDMRGTSHSRFKVVTGDGITAHQDCFIDDVHSFLPFIEISSERAFNYDGVLMDEEHIIGLMEDEENGSIRQLDVFIMAPDSDLQTCDCREMRHEESQ